MREGWISAPLGDVCNVIGGGTPSKRNTAFYEGVIPWATVRDMRNEVLSCTEFCISEQAIKESSTNIVSTGNVVIATRVGLGKVCLLDQDTAINQDLRGVIPKSSNIDVRFLFRWFQSIAEIIEAEGTGATVRGVKLPFIKSLTFPLPPLPEQKRIVAILDEAFAGIDAAIANTQKNLANARELFESYLNAVFSQRGEGWHEKSLETISDSVSTGPFGSLLHKSDYVSSGVPLVNPINIIGEEIVPDNRKMIENETKKKLQSYILNKGDIVIARRGEIGRCAVVTEMQEGWVCGTGCFFIRPSRAINSHVLAHLLRSYSCRMEMERLSSGTTMLNLSNSALSNLKVSLPNLDEQNKIAEQILELKEQCLKIQLIYQQKLTALTELKQSLLQKAFSGELTADNVVPIISAKKSPAAPETDTPEFAAHVMAVAYHWHESQRRDKTFGRVKAQKVLHLVESLADVDMGRQPIKDAAGPNDSRHMRHAENWAVRNGFFAFVRRDGGDEQRGYDFVKRERYGEWLRQAQEAVAPLREPLDRVIRLMLPLTTRQAELVATVYAAWNNLLLDGTEPTEAAIIHEARDNWHKDKQNHSEARFRDAIRKLRDQGMVPMGTGKRVGGA